MLRLWSPVLAWCGVIFYLSSIPYLGTPPFIWKFLFDQAARIFPQILPYDREVELVMRKTMHMLEYAVLTRLLARALTGSTTWTWKKIFAWSLGLAIFYAVTDEFHQQYVPGRTGSLRDILVDSAGAWIALGLKP